MINKSIFHIKSRRPDPRDSIFARPKYVEVRLYGGLGNQLFQYHFGKYISKELNIEVHFDLSWINQNTAHQNSDIRLLLDFSDIQLAKVKKGITFQISDFLTKLSLRSKVIQFLLGIRMEVEIDNLSKLKIRNKSKFRGYYQNLAPNVMNHLDLKLKSQEKLAIASKLEKFFTSHEATKYIAVHVRGGDYLVSDSIYAGLSTDYYQSALDTALQWNPGAQVIVFTDDLLRAREILPMKDSYIWATNLGFSTVEEFLIMSSAVTIIISNSTFSYWAAVLQNSPASVIAPEEWFRKSGYSKPKYLSNWKII